MMNISKRLLGLMALTVMVVTMIGCIGGSETVKIGMLSPQTGPIAQYAPGFEDAAKIAIADLNAAHEGDFEFELIMMDTGCDGTQAATSAQTLVDSGVSAIVGAACSGATLGAIAVAAPAGVPMVSYAALHLL